MWNRYQPFRREIRFFPHIIPIAFPLIFPLGFVLAFWLFHLIFPILMVLLLAAVVLFIVRAFTLGSPGAAWNSMKSTGTQWQQKFTTRNQQTPYYQPPQPYYQPSPPAGQEQPAQQYGQGYQYQQPVYRPVEQPVDPNQPRTRYQEQVPPTQQ